MKNYNFRFQDEDYALVRHTWKQTFPKHGMPFNSWVIYHLLEASRYAYAAL